MFYSPRYKGSVGTRISNAGSITNNQKLYCQVCAKTEQSWQKTLIARWQMPHAKNASVSKNSSGNCIFHWTNSSGIRTTARQTDKVIPCAYCPSKKKTVFSLDAGIRANGDAVLSVAVFDNEETATWISFLNANGNVANSVFAEMVS